METFGWIWLVIFLLLLLLLVYFHPFWYDVHIIQPIILPLISCWMYCLCVTAQSTIWKEHINVRFFERTLLLYARSVLSSLSLLEFVLSVCLSLVSLHLTDWISEAFRCSYKYHQSLCDPQNDNGTNNKRRKKERMKKSSETKKKYKTEWTHYNKITKINVT